MLASAFCLRLLVVRAFCPLRLVEHVCSCFEWTEASAASEPAVELQFASIGTSVDGCPRSFGGLARRPSWSRCSDTGHIQIGLRAYLSRACVARLVGMQTIVYTKTRTYTYVYIYILYIYTLYIHIYIYMYTYMLYDIIDSRVCLLCIRHYNCKYTCKL